MRSFLLAVVALGLFASPASAAVIEIEDHFCGCDPSSGDEDTRGLIVRAAPGELNRISVTLATGGVVIEDLGAPLTGACQPASSGSRFCRGEYDGVAVYLGDGSDQVSVQGLAGPVDGGPGDDDIVVAGPPRLLTGGAGADRLDSRLAPGSGISYAGHTEGVTVSVNGIADDGAPGEGDNVLGAIGAIQGGSGDDVLDAGATVRSITGEGGDDTLVGGPQTDYLLGGDGDDTIAAGEGDDRIAGGAGADVLGGGPGRDEVSYGGAQPLRLSIGDGPNDGAAGEGDDIREDVEDLTGGQGSDVLIGDDDANRLIAYGGQDVLRGGAGADQLIGWGDGDELDAGAGPDRVEAGALDRPLLVDGERDLTDCRASAPVVVADALDSFRRCAPRPRMRPRGRLRHGRLLRLGLRCPAPSAVPCNGRFVVRLIRGRRISRTVRFGPIQPGGRVLLRVRLLRALDRDALIRATGVSLRDDNIQSSTSWRAGL
jgi:hypothetical protein